MLKQGGNLCGLPFATSSIYLITIQSVLGAYYINYRAVQCERTTKISGELSFVHHLHKCIELAVV